MLDKRYRAEYWYILGLLIASKRDLGESAPFPDLEARQAGMGVADAKKGRFGCS
jgi:hypothetical protein